MVLPSQSDMRIEQMVTFVTDAQKLRYDYHSYSYYLENIIIIITQICLPFLSSPYWRAPVKLLPKETSLSKRAGHSSSLVLPCPRIGLAPNVQQRGRRLCPTYFVISPHQPQICPFFRTVSQTEGLCRTTQESFFDRSLLPELYIHVASNCLKKKQRAEAELLIRRTH